MTGRLTESGMWDAEKPLMPRIVAVGTALPPHAYRQEAVLEFLGITDRRMRSLFLNSGIERRYLSPPSVRDDGRWAQESQGQLLRKHATTGVTLGSQAIRQCVERMGGNLEDIRFLTCVTSTGLLTPGFSALLVKDLGLRTDCARLDVVGMGCNAGLNGLTAVGAWASTHPGQVAMLLCVEVCSAAYVVDRGIRTAVVNSLFGDGVAAVAVVSDSDVARGPTILRSASLLIPEAIDAMRFEWDEGHGKFSFFLDAEVPYTVGAHAERGLERLLDGTGLRRSDIAHWILHSGGKKVIDAVRVNLGLSRWDVRHTTSVLREHGNMSSASFLFSYRRLLDEGVVTTGDHGVMMTMGPGSTIEFALLQW